MKVLLFFPAYFWLLLSALFFAGGEYLSKKWGASPTISLTMSVVGIYALGSLAWLPALLHKNELALMGTAWLLLATVGSIVVGVFLFGETLTPLQWVGMAAAMVAMVLLNS